MLKKYIIIIVVCFNCVITSAQDSLFTYTRIIKTDSLSQEEIFNRTLVWCSKIFNDSKSAINVKEKAAGILAGKAYYISMYKVPKKKDSVNGQVYNNFYFDWTIEIKNNKLRFQATDILFKWLDNDYPVTTTGKPPIDIMFQSKEKTQTEWDCSKSYLAANLDKLLNSLQDVLNKHQADW